MQLRPPKARTQELVVHEVSDEVLVYDLRSSKAHCLNGTSSFVWSVCDGTNTVADIARLTGTRFGAAVSEDLIEFALDQLSENDLLEHRQPERTSRGRREWIKRVGLTAVIALPAVASLVAPPNALAAQSCACVNPGECLTQTTCPSTTNCNGAGTCAP